MTHDGADQAPAVPGDDVVRRAVLRFASWSVLAFMVLVAAGVVIGHRFAEDVALEDARLRGATISDSIASPLVDGRVRAGDPDTLQELDRVMRAAISDGSVRHVKLWGEDGTVIWSDEQALVGRRFALDSDVRELFGTRRVTAELSDLTKAENVQERSDGELLEVYAGTRDSERQPFVFEAYLTTDRLRSYERKLAAGILGLTLGGLLLFLVAVLPLAASLARRVKKGEAERTRMMRHNLLVTEQERRRLAQDLHDGVIQDLAGLGFALPVVAAQLPDTPEARAAHETINRASTTLQDDVAFLRSALIEIYPPDLAAPGGFLRAVQDLGQSVREKGTDVQIRIPTDYGENLETTRLAYGVIREGLRNVLKHAHAAHARVELGRQGPMVHVSVSDDGVGMEPGAPVTEGHLGLKLLEDTVTGFGGALTVESAEGGGTVVDAVFPPINLSGVHH